MEKIIEIPEGYEARIEGNKVVLEPKESEDEKFARIVFDLPFKHEADYKFVRAYLEKLKEPEFTHHEVNESLRDAVTHQMEDDGDVDDFTRRGIDDIALKYAMLGARWQKEQQELPIEEGADLYFDEWKQNFPGNPTKRQCFEEGIRYSERKQKEQKPVEWNEVDYDGEIADLCDGSMSLTSKDIARHFYELGQRCHKPTEWSEEDRRKLNRIYEILGHAADDKGFLCSKRIIGDNEAIELQNFLRALLPRPHWKPNEEQMKALFFVKEYFKDVPSAMKEYICLVQLYDDLKRLM